MESMKLKRKTLEAVESCSHRRLKRLIERGATIHGSCSQQCAVNGDVECLRIVHENGGYWNEKTCCYAAFHGNLECLVYARENGCPWNKDTLSMAIHQGHLDCAEYYLEHATDTQELKMDPNFCKYAAWGGNVKCLEFLHRNGFVWNMDTTVQTAIYGRVECLKYAIENGCPFSLNKCYKSTKNNACISYLLSVRKKIKASVKIQAHVKGFLLRKIMGVHNPHCEIGKQFVRRLFQITDP